MYTYRVLKVEFEMCLKVSGEISWRFGELDMYLFEKEQKLTFENWISGEKP